MFTSRSFRVPAIGFIGFTAACSPEPHNAPLAPPQFDVASSAFITGNVTGPAGNLCNSLPEGTTLRVRAINLGTQAIAAAQNLVCPANAYSLFVPPGTYVVRGELPPIPEIIGDFPWRTITTPPVEVVGSDVARDLPVPIGTPLGGGATIDGQPLAGISVNLNYDQAPAFAAAAATTGPDGGWVEFFGRIPTRLQAGVRLRTGVLCDALGGIVRAVPPDAFTFPDEAAGISCTLATAPAVRFSHDLTRTVVTPMPGDIGGLSPGLVDQFGLGWGVQFPVNPGSRPVHGPVSGSELFSGGLIVAVRPDRLLSGVELGGYVQCGPVCRDFGPDAQLTFASSPQFGKKVMWRYSDAMSAEGVGLKVVQKSYDGKRPADYVLFRFIFTNSAAAPLTFYAGMFGDWDIGEAFTRNVGATELDGRLMYMTNVESGPHAGSLLLSDAPISGNAFLSLRPFPVPAAADYVAALAGDVTVPFVDTPDDYLALHAAGPIALDPGGSADIWIAIVAGEDLAELRSNAAAAQADVAGRGASAAGDGLSAEGGVRVSGIQRVRPARLPTCKKGCILQ